MIKSINKEGFFEEEAEKRKEKQTIHKSLVDKFRGVAEMHQKEAELREIQVEESFKIVLRLKTELHSSKLKLKAYKSEMLEDDCYMSDMMKDYSADSVAYETAFERLKLLIQEKHSWLSPGNVKDVYEDTTGKIFIKDEITWEIENLENFVSDFICVDHDRENKARLGLKALFDKAIKESMKIGQYDIPGVKLVNKSVIRTRLKHKRGEEND